MSEKEQESHKIGLQVGSNFQDTQEVRQVLDWSKTCLTSWDPTFKIPKR